MIKKLAKSLSGVVFFAALIFSSSQVFAQELEDVDDYVYEYSIDFLTEEGVVHGYDDGFYKPDNPVNRAEFLKITLESSYGEIPEVSANENCGFWDVQKGAWYVKYVCYGKDLGVIGGYPDGSFKPEQSVNFVEASKIAELSFEHSTAVESAGEPWYENDVEFVSDYYLAPPDIEALDEYLTRGQTAELLARFFYLKMGSLDQYLDMLGYDILSYENGGLGTTDFDELDLSWLEVLKNWISLVLGDTETYEIEEEDISGWYRLSDLNPSTLVGQLSAVEDEGSINYSFEDDRTYTLMTMQEGDSSLNYESTVYAPISAEDGFTKISENVSYSQYFNVSDSDSYFDWFASDSDFSEQVQKVIGNIDFDMTVSDDSLDETLYISDEEFDFSFSTYDAADSNSDDLTNQFFTYEPEDGFIFEQQIQDDYYGETFYLNPGDGISLNMTYNDADITEFLNIDTNEMDMELFMGQEGFSETQTYSDDGFAQNFNSNDDGTFDMTLVLQSEVEYASLTFESGVLTSFTGSFAEGDNVLVMGYDGDVEGGALSGTWYESGYGYPIFESDAVWNGDNIRVDSDSVKVEGELWTLDWSPSSAKLNILFDAIGEKADGEVEFDDSGVDDGHITLGLGEDKEEREKADPAADEWHWGKDFDFGLDGFIWRAKQEGEVKGYGLDKDWDLNLSPLDAYLKQEIEFKRKKLEKQFEGTVTMWPEDGYHLWQKIKLGGTFGGTDIDVANETTAEDGEIQGENTVVITGDGFIKENHITYGNLIDLTLDQILQLDLPYDIKKNLILQKIGGQLSIQQTIGGRIGRLGCFEILGGGTVTIDENGFRRAGFELDASCPSGWGLKGGVDVDSEGNVTGSAGVTKRF